MLMCRRETTQSSVGAAVFRGKFFQIPEASLPNSGGSLRQIFSARGRGRGHLLSVLRLLGRFEQGFHFLENQGILF